MGDGQGAEVPEEVPRHLQAEAREFFKFVKAVGTRYGGNYSRRERGRLQAAARRLLGGLQRAQPARLADPAVEGRNALLADLYRDLWYYGRTALDATGHGVGRRADRRDRAAGQHQPPARVSPIYPKRFIREFFCMTARARRTRLRRLQAHRAASDYTAWAHHPYTKTAAPTARDTNRDSITMANINELPALLDQVTAKKSGLAALNLVALTEYGYETNPPDPFSGISLAKQAEYINEGDYLAYKQPARHRQHPVPAEDVPPVKHVSGKAKWFTYQSGLFTPTASPSRR